MENSRNENRMGSDQKPFIKLFRSPRGWYFFDTNRDEICEVDENTYADLEQIMKGVQNAPASEPIAQLQDEGWLSTHRPKEMRSPVTDQVEYRLAHSVNTLNLQVTQSCNLCCIYCPYANNTDPLLSRHHTSKTMNFETARKAIDFLAGRSDEAERISICFYGGEPLLEFPLIRQCVEYAEEVFDGKEVLFFITTNATLMTDEVIDYFADHHFFVTFSLDGPKDIHDKHRIRADGSATYDVVMKALEKTVKRYGDRIDSHITVNMVMNPADSFDETLKWLENPVFSNLIIQATIAEDQYLEKDFPMTPEFLKGMTYHLALNWLDYLGLVDGLKTNAITRSMVNRAASDAVRLLNGNGCLPDIMAPGGPCISGIRKLFVNTDGVFFPCEKANDLSACMIIGDLEKGFDSEQIKQHINIAQLTPEACKNCWAIVHCICCQRQADGGDELSGTVKNRFCEETKQVFLSSLKTSIMIRECRTAYFTRREGNE